MKEEQAKRLAEILEEIKSSKGTENEMKDFEGLKLVDLFNSVTAAGVAKLNVINELFTTAGGLPDDTPEDLIKYEAARLESITRAQINGLCDCLLAVVACEGLNDAEKD